MSDRWETTTLGEISQLNSGGTPLKSTKSFWDGGDIPWYSSGELNDVYTNDSKKCITQAGLDRSNAKLFPKGSLLLGMYDTAALKASILDRDAAFNQAVAGMLPTNGTNFKFLLYAIWHVRPEVLKLRRGVRQKNLSLAKIKAIAVPYPDRPEQRRIVGILDEAFAGIATAQANAEKNLQNARALFESHLNAVFTTRGDGWVEKLLVDVCDFQNGYAFKSKWYTKNGKGIRLLRNANVSHGFVDWTNDVVHLPAEQSAEFERFQLNKDDVVLSLDRPVISTGLKAAILREDDIPSLLLQRVLRITSDVINHAYIYHWLFSNQFRDQIDPGRSLGVPHISAREVGSVPIAFPKRAGEQNRVVQSVQGMVESTSRLESIYQRKLAALDELKKSLLHQAFSGQLSESAANEPSEMPKS